MIKMKNLFLISEDLKHSFTLVYLYFLEYLYEINICFLQFVKEIEIEKHF